MFTPQERIHLERMLARLDHAIATAEQSGLDPSHLTPEQAISLLEVAA